MLNIAKEVDNARYSDILEKVVNFFGGVAILRKNYFASFDGYVDIDVLLDDGSVLSLYYSYGSCEVCDEWALLSEKEIIVEMMKSATIFQNVKQYVEWRKSKEQGETEE